MGKTITIAIILIAAAVILFIPRYDLYEKESSFSDNYTLRESGFWSKEECENAGRNTYQGYYKCTETNAYENMMGKGADYSSERQY